MKPVTPRKYGPEDGKAVIFAKDQPEYHPLPAMVTPDGCVHTEWELSPEELQMLMRGAHVQLTVLTFGGLLQPVRLSVEGVEPEPEVGTPG